MGILRYIMPVLVLGTGVAISAGIYAAKPEPEKKEVVIEPRKVRVITARRGAVDLTVESQGTVQPRHMIDLVPEVAGRTLSTEAERQSLQMPSSRSSKHSNRLP